MLSKGLQISAKKRKCQLKRICPLQSLTFLMNEMGQCLNKPRCGTGGNCVRVKSISQSSLHLDKRDDSGLCICAYCPKIARAGMDPLWTRIDPCRAPRSQSPTSARHKPRKLFLNQSTSPPNLPHRHNHRMDNTMNVGKLLPPLPSSSLR